MKRAALLVAACGAPTAPPHNAAPTHDVELAIASKREVRVYRVGNRLELERTVELPSTASMIAWAGDRLVVQLGAIWTTGDEDQSLTDPAREGEIGFVTDHYEPLPALPETAWYAPPPNLPANAMSKVDPPRWYMVVTQTGEVWQARAEWTTYVDSGQEDQYVYARRVPEGKVTLASPISIRAPELPKVAAPAKPHVELVAADSPSHVVRCDDRTFGSVDNDGFHDISKLTWLASEPPIYEVELDYTAMYEYQTYPIFEGCAKSDTLREALAGPAGVTAIYGPSRLVMVRAGKAIDSVAGGHTAAFR